MAEVKGKAAWGVAVAATLGMSVSYIDRQTLAAIAPSVTKSLAIDNTHYGWLLSAFSLAYLAFAPLAGTVVDRYGARRGFAAAVVVWSLVAASHALVGSFASLFALRILLGTAESPSFPAASQALRRALPDARRPLAFGLLFTGSSIGAVVAAKLSVRLEAAYGFRGAFAGTALLGTLWIPFWLFMTRGHGLDRGVSVVERKPWLDLLRSPPVLRVIVATIGAAPLMMFVLNWTSKYFVDAWGMPKDAIANHILVAPVAFDVGAVGFGALNAAYGRTNRLMLLAMMLGAALALTPLAPTPALAAAIFGVSACGGGGIYAIMNADTIARVPEGRASSAGGIAAGAQSLAHVIAGPLVGLSVDRTHGYGAALVVLGLLTIPCTLGFVLWPGMRDRRS